MHEIQYITFGARYTPKGIQRECDKISRANSDSKVPLYSDIRFPKVTCKSYDDAVKWIEEHDEGWYDCIAIKFKDNRKTYWLAKIEYHV